MITRQTTLFSKARKEAPADAEAVSHKLLSRAGYIDQLASGIFSLLPLGQRVNDKITNIVREEMNALGAQEVMLPALQPATLWEESGRLETMDPPLFRVTDRHERLLVLGSTHEEVITDLARKNIESYKDLPAGVYQIQTKFRNEARATGGLLRVREFQMKDLYSFHPSMESLAEYYEHVKQAYFNIFSRCDLKVRAVQAMSGSIGGSVSHEFSIEAPTGEDKVAMCPKCDFAANTEAISDNDICPKCNSKLEIKSCIENGHIFQLGTKYSESMGALFTDIDGTRKPLVMGCYGIGIGRLFAAIAETHNDEKGLAWPESVSPYRFHIVPVQKSVLEWAEKLATDLGKHHDVLFDDREISAGQKFAESDLLGIQTRIVVSEKTRAQDSVEIVNRQDLSTQLQTLTQLLSTYP